MQYNNIDAYKRCGKVFFQKLHRVHMRNFVLRAVGQCVPVRKNGLLAIPYRQHARPVAYAFRRSKVLARRRFGNTFRLDSKEKISRSQTQKYLASIAFKPFPDRPAIHLFLYRACQHGGR